MREDSFSGFSSSISSIQETSLNKLNSNTVSDAKKTITSSQEDNKNNFCSTILANKYVIIGYIGKGSFGQVFTATRLNTPKSFAIKLIAINNAQDFASEHHILSLLKGNVLFPELIDEGTHNNYKFIVMELLGANLSRIRKLLANWRFKSNIVVKIGICILDALNIVHNIGYTHSDVKPSNMCIGQGEKVRLSLVDFGLSRKIDRVSSYAKFRGTRKYCSINAHQQIAHAPSDDIASLFYSLIELSEGVLPWSSLHEKNDICFQKRMLTKETVFKYQSPKLWLFYVDGYENCSDRFELDYSLLLKNLESCLDDPKCSSITTEDWKYLNNR